MILFYLGKIDIEWDKLKTIEASIIPNTKINIDKKDGLIDPFFTTGNETDVYFDFF